MITRRPRALAASWVIGSAAWALVALVAVAGPTHAAGAPAAPAPAPQAPPPSAPSPSPTPPAPDEPVRDAIGDLNSAGVKQGDFPGSVRIPGPGGVSFGIGGFIKSLAFHDTKAEGRESVFLPALLGGMGRDDQDGTTSLSAELSRVNFDARVNVGETKLRGYVEFDFSGDLFKWRHGYLTWSGRHGELLAGKSWSTFMDLQTLPDGLGEPTVSGAIFTRQAQFRYTNAISEKVKLSVAIEDSASSDVQAETPVPTRSGYPDFIATVNVGSSARHFQVGGMVRSLEFDPNDGEGDSGTGWGINIGAHANLGTRVRVFGAFAYGEGLGRYLVGVVPAAGAFVDVEARELSVRENLGGFGGVRFQLSSSCRSSLVYGYASAENDPRQPPSAFKDSSFALANVLCKANKFLTAGVELNYGTRTNRDGSDIDNLRVMVGFQLF